MSFRAQLLFLTAALAVTVAAAHSTEHPIYYSLGGTGSGLVGEVISHFDQEMLMESDSARRQLSNHAGYISYGALARNNVPCGERGQSYYNCHGHQAMNPYTRGCTRASKCARAKR